MCALDGLLEQRLPVGEVLGAAIERPEVEVAACGAVARLRQRVPPERLAEAADEATAVEQSKLPREGPPGRWQVAQLAAR